MNEPAQRPPDAVNHETSDASAFYVLLFALGLSLTIGLVLLLLIWMFWRFEGSAERADPQASPTAIDQKPPEPRLQAQPAADLARHRHDEDENLRSYRWIDQQQGIVQIPINRAIDVLAERGIPEPEPSQSPATKQEPKP